jgi:hypothetical protein
MGMFSKRAIRPVYPAFADLTEERHFPGKKVNINDILGLPLLVLAFKVEPSKKNEGTECLHLSFELGGAKCVTFTSGIVLIKQCRQLSDKMPFTASIIRIKNYYTFA